MKKAISVFLFAVFVLSSVSQAVGAVGAPYFTESPKDVDLHRAETAHVTVAADAFGKDGHLAEYEVQALFKTGFIPISKRVSQPLGEVTTVPLRADGTFIAAAGCYTARVAAFVTDENGDRIATAFSPAFSITVLPDAILAVSAEKSYHTAEKDTVITAKIHPSSVAAGASYAWYAVADGETVKLSDTERFHGVSVTGCDTPSLVISQDAAEVTEAEFFLILSIGPSGYEEASEKVTITLYPHLENGFTWDGVGVLYYRADRGEFAEGLFLIGGATYLFEKGSCRARSGRVVYGGRVFRCALDGRVLDGLVETPYGFKYYENGIRFIGERQIDGKIRSFDPLTGYSKKQTGEQK